MVYVGLALLGDKRSITRAQYALRTAEADFTRQGQAADVALVWQSLARLRLGTSDDPAEIREAIELLEMAFTTLRTAGQPLEWAEAQIKLGDAHSALARSLGSGPEADEAVEHARANWRAALHALTADEAFARADAEESVGLISDAEGRLQALDRRGIPEPSVTRASVAASCSI